MEIEDFQKVVFSNLSKVGPPEEKFTKTPPQKNLHPVKEDRSVQVLEGPGKFFSMRGG